MAKRLQWVKDWAPLFSLISAAISIVGAIVAAVSAYNALKTDVGRLTTTVAELDSKIKKLERDTHAIEVLNSGHDDVALELHLGSFTWSFLNDGSFFLRDANKTELWRIHNSGLFSGSGFLASNSSGAIKFPLECADMEYTLDANRFPIVSFLRSLPNYSTYLDGNLEKLKLAIPQRNCLTR